jgi:hypothetical protein
VSRLPTSPIDAQSPELRLQARINDLELRLASQENAGAPGNDASFSGAGLSAYMNFTTPAGNYTPPVGSFGLCGWFSTITVGPNQAWDVRGGLEISTSSATWIRTAFQHTFRDGSGAVGPSGVSITSLIFTEYSNSGGPVIPTSTTWATLFTNSSVPPDTTVRLHLQFNNGAAGPIIARDGNYFAITARRVA